jgi:hypothetical protein
MILILRGHIRESFDNVDLYNFVQDIYNIDPNLKIFIHTWSIFANNISWKYMETDNRIVTNEVIYTYFGELSKLIKHIIIDDDSKIELIGNVEGNINNGPMRLIGWKNYWYGKHKIIEYVHNKTSYDETMINTRFDLFNNTHSFYKETYMEFIQNNIENKFNKNVFIEYGKLLGVDNIYIGNIDTMYTLSNYFFYLLDDILSRNKDTIHQETLVHRINNQLFG